MKGKFHAEFSTDIGIQFAVLWAKNIPQAKIMKELGITKSQFTSYYTATVRQKAHNERERFLENLRRLDTIWKQLLELKEELDASKAHYRRKLRAIVHFKRMAKLYAGCDPTGELIIIPIKIKI